MRGIPVRVELGPKDVEAGQAVLVRRDTREKQIVPLEELPAAAQQMLESVQKDLFERALAHREAHTYDAVTYDEFSKIAETKPGFIRAMWCGDEACENKIKEDLSVTSRCIPGEQVHLSDTCICCGKPAKKMVYWGKAY